MAYVTQCDIAMLLNVLLIPTHLSSRHIDLKLYWNSKSQLFFRALEQLCNTCERFLHISHEYENHRLSSTRRPFFHDLTLWGMQWLSSLCRYLTPLLSRAGENPIHFQLLYSLTVDLVSKHKGEGIQPSTHTLPVFIKHWVSITWVALVWEGGRPKRHNTTFKSWCWPKEQPSLPPSLWKDPLMVWTEL